MRIRAIPVTALSRAALSLAAMSLAALTLCACIGPLQTTRPQPAGPTPGEASGTGSPAPNQPPVTIPGPLPTPSQEVPPTEPAPPPANPPAPVGSTEPAPPPGQNLQLRAGQTARLAYFDVTFQRFARGQDGVSAGWRVEVCYRRPHPNQNADNTTRVSADPWSVQVLDAEGPDGRPTWLAINEFPRDNGWSPPYPTTQLRLGSCQTGWLGVRHGNPDLQFLAVRYAPADFGDVVTWATRD